MTRHFASVRVSLKPKCDVENGVLSKLGASEIGFRV